MQIFRTHRTTLLLVFALILAAAMFNVSPWRGTAQNLQESLLPLTPGLRERLVTLQFINLLEDNHISQRTVDQTLSKEAFRLYIKSLDARKSYFYQSDIDEFKTKYESRFCEFLKRHPVEVEPAFEIYNRYLIRLKERVSMIQKILETPMDFTVDEEYVIEKSKDFTMDENIIREKGLRSFPNTEEEAYERWRKRLKYELLGLKNEATTNKQKREKAIADGKEPETFDERDPVERLKKRYVSLQRRMLLEVHTEDRESLNSIRQQANDEVMELLLNAVAGVLDPHSNYFSPATEEAFGTGMSKNFQGIGATLSSEDEYIVVRDVIAGSPADKSGIRKNDKIQGVGQGKDGKIEEVINFKVTDVVKRIRGPKETVVRLDILPGGKTPPKVVEIVRDTITLDDQAAHSEIFKVGQKTEGTPYKVGFIELPDFYLDMNALRQREINVRSSTTDLKQMLKEFVEANVDAVILDLRDNGGGSLQEAITITGLFTGAGTVVQVKDEANSLPLPKGGNDPSCDWTGPLVVVTSKYSASASEILAGAIKDYRRGLIIGDSTTHGKGTVQSVLDFNRQLLGGAYGSGKITIQGYYLPSGVSPQKVGVESDIVLPSLSDVREDIMESDLDNALALRRVNAAPNFTPKQYVTPQIIAELKRRSDQRIKEDEEFRKQQEKIFAYKEASAKKIVPLNEAKYIEEMKRFNSDEWEQEELEDLLNKSKKIKRDFYIEEVLALTVDYVKMSQELGVAYPKERTIQQPARRGFFGFGF